MVLLNNYFFSFMNTPSSLPPKSKNDIFRTYEIPRRSECSASRGAEDMMDFCVYWCLLLLFVIVLVTRFNNMTQKSDSDRRIDAN